MEFDVVIATRNRQAALRISLPLILGQSRLPRKLILVDSSDDHCGVRELVEAICAPAAGRIELEILQTEAGSSLQRNVGVAHCVSPVTLMPDDDSLWYPGYTEAVMRVYERDVDNTIGGVCGTESGYSPTDLANAEYRMALKDSALLPSADFLDTTFPDPLCVVSEEMNVRKTLPSWFGEEKAVISAPMTGFRMSFRTELIRKHPFDESLGRYALFEDRDASLAIMKHHVLARAIQGRVFHYRSPESRVRGLEWGVMHVLNRAYVVCKHAEEGSRARNLITRYSYYKLVRYLAQATSAYGRQRVLGAWRAIAKLPSLTAAPRDGLTSRYLQCRAECLGG